MDVPGRLARWKGSLALALLGLSGCSEELGSNRAATTRVVGVVRDAGRPVSGGWIEFIPTEGTVGRMRSAPIGPDGRFEALEVPIGTVGVGFAAVRAFQTDPRYFHSLSTPIRREIREGSAGDLTIDLREELIRFQAESAASRL